MKISRVETNQWRGEAHEEQKVEFHPFLQVLVLLYIRAYVRHECMFLRTFINMSEHACVHYMSLSSLF